MSFIPEDEKKFREILEAEEKPKLPVKKISKANFLINLWKGKPGRRGDTYPSEPVRDVKELAKRLKKAEEKGYFKSHSDVLLDRNEFKYAMDVRWYLSHAAKAGLIDREYKPHEKKDED